MTPVAWDAELARDGKVVLPLRRRARVLTLVLSGALATVNGRRSYEAMTHGQAWSFWDYWNLAIFVLFLLVFVVTVRSTIAGTPRVTIDRQGVTKGDESVTWTRLTSIEQNGGNVKLSHADGELTIDGKNIPADQARALTDWLRSTADRYKIS
ncbi:hypothetical protein [Kribbella deserti]|uniref:PH domain-containing protein n=1 Tax=Kribbella deserti TaxID=1926257 RepID=A0ABV6QQN3_9ACTN